MNVCTVGIHYTYNLLNMFPNCQNANERRLQHLVRTKYLQPSSTSKYLQPSLV